MTVTRWSGKTLDAEALPWLLQKSLDCSEATREGEMGTGAKKMNGLVGVGHRNQVKRDRKPRHEVEHLAMTGQELRGWDLSRVAEQALGVTG